MPEPAKYANIKIPSAFITPYVLTAKDGRTFDKAYVHFPDGTNVNGVDLSHYSCDIFMNDRMKQQQLDGAGVTVHFQADKPVEIWTGKAGDPEHPYQKFEVNPWQLVHGIKESLDKFKADKAAERDAEKSKAVSLKDVEEESRDSSSVLEGRDGSADRAQER